MRKFYSIKSLILWWFIGIMMTHASFAQNAASPPEFEYDLLVGAEIWHNKGRKITTVYQKKAAPGGLSNSRLAPKPQNSSDDPPVVVVIDENGCLYGCTEQSWGPIECPNWNFNADNPPAKLYLQKNENAEVGKSKFAIGKSSCNTCSNIRNATKKPVLTDQRTLVANSEAAGIWICKIPYKCHWYETLEPDRSSFRSVQNGTIIIAKPDRSVLCLHEDGKVSTNCGPIPTLDSILKQSKSVDSKN